MRQYINLGKSKGLRPKKNNMNNEPRSKHVAIRFVDRLYKIITVHLQNGRERARTNFFDELGYFFVRWTSHSVPIDIEPPTVASAYTGSVTAIVQLSAVPATL